MTANERSFEVAMPGVSSRAARPLRTLRVKISHPRTGRDSADRREAANGKNGRMALQRMDNVGIVVESLDAAILFFAELGLELEGEP